MSEYIVELTEKQQTDLRKCRREQIVRCRDCTYSCKDGTLCMFFASWEPIAGGDEHAEIPADVEPNGFCAWASKWEKDSE